MPEVKTTQQELYLYLQHNSCRHLIEISAMIHRQLLSRAFEEGFKGLKLNFDKIIAFVQHGGARIADIAEATGISKQALGVLANEVESKGYISRHTDPLDARSKQLRLTKKGEQLIAFSVSAVEEIEKTIFESIGSKPFIAFKKQIDLLCNHLDLPKAFRGQLDNARPEFRFALQMSSLAHYCEQQMLLLSHEKGYQQTKLSHGHILRFIDNSAGITVNDLARLNGVSKQAVSKTVSELEDLNYLNRIENPNDKRSKSLALTNHGMQLMRDAKLSIDSIEAAFADILGQDGCKALLDNLQKAYISLGLDSRNTNRQLDQLLQHALEQLWNKSTPREQGLLFTKTGKRVNLSSSALERLATLEVGQNRN